MRHVIKYLIDGFKKEPYCKNCGQDNPNPDEECSYKPLEKQEEKLAFVSGLPVDNFR